jgi:bifunctional DNase/RNase
MTHDLFIDIAEQSQYKITKVEINDVDEQTYFATIFMYNKLLDKEIQIDSRPSDAIAIALRAEIPIYVTENVLAVGVISTDVEKDEQEAAEFKNFIQDIKPSDFEKLLKKNYESDQ